MALLATSEEGAERRKGEEGEQLRHSCLERGGSCFMQTGGLEQVANRQRSPAPPTACDGWAPGPPNAAPPVHSGLRPKGRQHCGGQVGRWKESVPFLPTDRILERTQDTARRDPSNSPLPKFHPSPACLSHPQTFICP
jgi:hypothetical protein